MIRTLGEKEFGKEVLENNHLNLVLFKTDWNGSSQIISIIYEDLEKVYGGTVQFFTVDIESEQKLGKLYGATEIPTILFFKDAKIVDHITGLAPKNSIITKIETAFAKKRL